MFRAIDSACKSNWDSRIYSRTFGLRAIKTFERVNGFQFDPFNKEHTSKVCGAARHEHFFWKAHKILKRSGARNAP